MNKQLVRSSERGVTSLFIVLFAALLLSIITVSFASMMIREQQRSSDDELSQSAYDAALAGVEDAKRVMAACSSGTAAACTAIDNGGCDTIQSSGIIGSTTDPEVFVESTMSGDGRELNQAYTCVIVKRDTPNYLGTLAADESDIIPLQAAGNFTHVTISWHTSQDASTSSPTGTPNQLPPLSAWATGRPALLRAQLMQFTSGNINPANFDNNNYAHTLYLYPQTIGGGLSFGLDSRRTGGLVPQGALCTNGSFPLSGYACSETIALPALPNRTAYLRLTGLYAGTHFKVELLNGAVPINFRGVQPSIDSTGRANDLFRRVEARIQTAASFPYPRATVDITNNFCKTFSITSDPAEYDDGTCNPAIAGD